MSNNLSEIAVKPVAITRKNSLFSDSPAGAEASALVFSIINTARANNLDPYTYLKYIFSELPNIDFASNKGILQEYLPWGDKAQLNCKIKITETDRNEENDIESA